MYKTISPPPELQTATCIQRLADNAFIPFCVDNVDYQRFKQDLADGAELLDAEGNVMDGKEYVKELP